MAESYTQVPPNSTGLRDALANEYANAKRLRDISSKYGVSYWSIRQRQKKVVVLRKRPARSYAGRKTTVGPEHGNYKNGRYHHGSGYINALLSADDPLAVMRDKKGYCKEHRLVMARAIGRPLTSKETVHHKNGDPADNRLSNLGVTPRRAWERRSRNVREMLRLP